MDIQEVELLTRLHDGILYVEEWKDIEGFEGQYSISSFGRIFSHSRVIQYRNRTIEGKIKPTPLAINKQYAMVCLWKNGKQTAFTVHSLVASHFILQKKEQNVVNHLDENKTNNFYKNLEWTTQRGNVVYSKKKTNMYGLVGISFHKKRMRYQGRFTFEGKLFFTRDSKTLEEAKIRLLNALLSKGLPIADYESL
jgi:hypothetical protein